eukprot:s78_g10.t1
MGNVCSEAPMMGAEVAIQKGLPPMKKATGPSVAIVYYSTYGHVKVMADELKKGLESTGVSVDLFQVPETLPPSALQAMGLQATGAPGKPADVMLLEREFLSELPKYDGFMFGMPTRFGMMASQMKAFFDGTGSLWQKGALAGKLGATFVSTGTQQGGQETTHFTAVTQLVHHGMCYVPLGYQAGGDGQFDLSEIHGGSPWGASTLAGADGSRQASALELKIAKKQGEVFGTAVKRTTAPAASKKAKVCIVYYSMYGHVKKLADEIAASMKEEGVSVDMFQAPELLGADVLKKMGAPAKPSDAVMDHAKVQQLADYDGLLFGIPTRFGSASAQMKAFFDSTGSLWQSGALAGKLTASFCSTGTLNGGQESTHMTTLTNMVHHGMIYVPLGYQAGGDGQFDMTEIHGGSPWGASTFAGADGSRQASATELKIARRQGKVFASKVKQMMKSAICYVPVHDNYMLNKQALASKSKPNGGQKAELLASEIFLSMARRCKLLRELLEEEGPEAEAVCHVLDYELQHGTQLLEDSPKYWASRLPEGYLRTVPTKALLNHFAAHSPLVKDGQRLAAVFGENSAASGVASLFLLPALAGPDEALSSTRIRESVVGCARLLKEHGYPKTALVALSQDVLSSAAALRAARADAEARGIRDVFMPTFAAMPQFSMIGPVYLQVYKMTDSRAVAVLAASLGESLLTFAPQRGNAQIQYNAVRPAHEHIELTPLTRISGPGFSFHVWRNAMAMMGIRLFSPYTEKVVRHIPHINSYPESKAILSDFSASIMSSMLSMPFNHVFSWACCSPELARMSQLERLQAYATFLIGNYSAPGRLSLLGRDLMVRISYTGFLFTGYHVVERRLRSLAGDDVYH